MAPYGIANKQESGDSPVATGQASVDRLLRTCLRHVEGPDRVTLYKSLQRRDSEMNRKASTASLVDPRGEHTSGANDGRNPRQRPGGKTTAAAANGR